MAAFTSRLSNWFCKLISVTPSRRRSSRSHVDPLESRTLLATLVSATKLTYQDIDGDNVTVTFSKSILTAGNVNSIFTFDTGNVDGSNATKQQLKSIKLAGIAGTAGTTIATVAVRSPTTGGDGLSALGFIDANGLDLGNVTLDGDLGSILAGDATTTTQGLGALKVHSIGRYGTTTGALTLSSSIVGSVSSLTTKTDIKHAHLAVADGGIGTISIGGSLIGGSDMTSGRIQASGNMGSVTIGGNLVGGAGANSGHIISLSGKIASVTIQGSLLGGAGTFSGHIYSGLDLGPLKISGDLVGGAGQRSGHITTGGNFASVTIGGSIRGGAGDTSGSIQGSTTTATLGAVKITGDLMGGTANNSGVITSTGATKFTSISIGGSLIGGANFSGRIRTSQEIGTLSILGNVVGGSASGATNMSQSGSIEAGRIGKLTIGGSVIAGIDATTGTFENNGSISTKYDIGTATLGGIIGNSTHAARIITGGQQTPTSTTDVALGSLIVKQNVEYANILAGHAIFGNADAQIGTVNIGGDWIASNLVAGAGAGADMNFGTNDDVKNLVSMTAKDVATAFSKITGVTIGGQIIGTTTMGDHFGFVAESIGSFKLGGTTISLVSGKSNDDFLIGITGDFRLNEI